jgi:hypothetical protein
MDNAIAMTFSALTASLGITCPTLLAWPMSREHARTLIELGASDGKPNAT